MIRKINWIFRRASIMPYKEYIYRCKRLIYNIVDCFLLKHGKQFQPDVFSPKVHDLRKSIFFNIHKDINKILPVIHKKKCISEADQILHNRYSFFELGDEFLGNNINWNFDYKNKVVFPLKYPLWGSHQFRQIGDLKYVYEINKHQELVRLAQAYTLTLDRKYIDKLTENINSWIEQCPYMRGVNWASPTVMAYRLISWTITFEMLRSFKVLSEGFLLKWAQVVFLHIHSIVKNYSKYSSAGNHLVSEATGVFIACLRWRIFFSGKELTFLDSAQKEAYSILLNEMNCQIYNDGVNCEQAISYQVFTANQFFLALFFGTQSGILFPQNYQQRLHKSGRFVSCIINKEGQAPNYGDEDAAWAFRLCAKESNKFLDQMSIFGIYFNDYYLTSGYELSESVYWLFGSQVAKFSSPKKVPIEVVKPSARRKVEQTVFPNGGYYVAACNRGSDEEVLLFFDYGPVGSRLTGSHGHADALSICLSIGGKWIFIDPGTYHYKNSLERRRLRVTSSHNTLNFGELSSQDQYLGPFLWGRRQVSTGACFGDGMFVGSVRWYTGEIHTRKINISDEKLLIVDSWMGGAPPSIVFNLSESVSNSVYLEQASTVIIRNDNLRCYLKAKGCSLALKDTKISPAFYCLVNSKKIVVHVDKPVGKQLIEVSWFFT